MTPVPVRERPLGKVRVASEVVASIAALAALEVSGIAAMCEPGGVQVPRLLRRQNGHRGVRMEMVGTAAIKIELFVAITAEAELPRLADELQKRVGQDIHKMLGLEVVEINIHVAELDSPER
jgi:uncharacterized alkaline shock family protein YloU